MRYATNRITFGYRRPEIRWELGGDGGAYKGRRREGGPCPGVWPGSRGGSLGDGEDDRSPVAARGRGEPGPFTARDRPASGDRRGAVGGAAGDGAARPGCGGDL